ncbi:kinase-like protein [Hesseltinella vesiculosa]|uniref:Kinase-like protein n=1 Tax=Hesseltinella vesiculosa TaxID=101127 RepID=A0A1X2GI54_9FUNG|nr:kinase-like protein [Hesseltinella vesiculosa]
MGALCCREEPVDLDSEVDLTHFALLRSVGKGAFGKVRVVQHKGTKQLFALKYINKAKCIRMRAVDNIISERRLLERLDYQFIVNLRYAFQDDENLFMVLDLMLGGDLRFHLERRGCLDEDCVRFYAAELALALHYLHQNHIVHRDVKPDNILLDQHGHAHLTDFNIAIPYTEAKPLTSVAGSMAYMAPEILKKQGYFASVDWWSLGIVCYELLFGQRPFRGKSNDALKQAILSDPVDFPDEPNVSPEAISAIKSLLARDINDRLGYEDQGFQRLKVHPWFKSIRWQEMGTKKIMPPFIPDDKRANFDPTHELEEILLEDNPLKAKKRIRKNRSTQDLQGDAEQQYTFNPYTDPEYQIMDDRFLTFDYTKPEQNLNLKRQQQRKLQQQPSSAKSKKQSRHRDDYNTDSPPHSPAPVMSTPAHLRMEDPLTTLIKSSN